MAHEKSSDDDSEDLITSKVLRKRALSACLLLSRSWRGFVVAVGAVVCALAFLSRDGVPIDHLDAARA